MPPSRKIKSLKVVSLFLIITSVILLIIGAILGEIEVYLFLIIPIIKIEGMFGILGILSLISGIFLFFITNVLSGLPVEKNGTDHEKIGGDATSDWGGIIFIGPIPIVIGSKRAREGFPKWRYLLLIGIVITVIIYLFAIAFLTFLIRV